MRGTKKTYDEWAFNAGTNWSLSHPLSKYHERASAAGACRIPHWSECNIASGAECEPCTVCASFTAASAVQPAVTQ